MKNLKKISYCRICGSGDLYDYLDLGILPIPNGFLTKGELKKAEKKYPLVICFCRVCSLSQLRYIVDPEIMFKNYLYIPSVSQTRVNNFKKFVEDARQRIKLNSKSLIVDIGSNDGALLNCFKNEGFRIVGVDPAGNLVKIAQLNGIPTELGYFDSKLAKKMVKKYGAADVMFATNVFAHVHDLIEFLRGVDTLLSNNGIFVSQFPYVLDLIRENQFDTIYHEHLSYFSIKSLVKLSEKTNLEIYDIVPSHLDGGSLKVYWKKRKNKKIRLNNNIYELLNKEEKEGLYDEKTYDLFRKKVEYLKISAKKQLKKLKDEGKHIVGYGAAAKGNILINYFDIDPHLFDYFVDSTSYKQGRFTPGKHIPIFEEGKIFQTKPDYILILAWNFAEEIAKKNKEYLKNGGKFMICIPEFKILD
ncbi:MAG TPA: class I SAM-dependent methyltransferase [Patescibacteria group bacterium]|nr:class I SAM-dependent methyltransferase [Patescibacteria group bacterium]